MNTTTTNQREKDETMTFVHRFPGGTTATVTADIGAYRRGSAHILTVAWSGPRPTKATLPAYRRWMHTVNQRVAEAVDGTLLYALQPTPDPTRLEWYSYAPGRAFRRERELETGVWN